MKKTKTILILLVSFIFLTQSLYSQQGITITGKVTDENGEALPGVNVVVQGNTGGTITDLTGNYSIQVPSESSVLQFSFVGYLQKTVTVNGQREINVNLTTDVKSLDEVVVVGYGTTLKKNLTTSISKVSPDDVPKAADNTIPQLLFGRAAGLQVTQESSQPGGRINLSIRGRGNPLIVVDGIIYPNSALEPQNGESEFESVDRGGLAGLNPSDIESIEVLKDASASIYGVNAADGVILITTKRGKSGAMNISYDGSRSIVQNMSYLEPLNAKNYMTYYDEISKDKYNADHNMVPFGPNPSDYIPKFSEQDIADAVDRTDWLSKVMRNGSIDNHNLSINGGSDKATYYFSGNYYNQKGTLENSSLERFTGRLNVTFDMTKFLKLNTDISANRNNYGNGGSGWQQGNAGTQAFGALQAALAYPTYLPVYDENGQYTRFQVIGNPVSLLDIDDKTKTNGVLANISLDIDIIKDMLSAKVLYGNNYDNSTRYFYIPTTTFWNQLNRSRASIFEQRRQNQTMEAVFSFKKSFGNAVNLDAVAGLGQYIEDGTGHGIETSDILDAINTTNLGAATGPKTISSYKYSDKRRSYFARGNFDILDRYLVSVAYRLDGTDKFFPDNKYDGFPSLSLGWKLSNEEFMSSLAFIDLFKFRASIGITGRTIGTAAYGVFGPDPNIVYFNNGAVAYTPYYQTLLDDPDLKWEKTLNKNIGLDYAFFKNRISGSLDFFSDEVTNLLTSRATDQLSYIASAYKNDGAMIRKGYDFSFNSYNIDHNKFSWKTVLNISHYVFNWEQRFKNSDLQPYVGEK
ncbi:MAG TPA: SusC/RagA family TonB-linked outer membrane protein, partial [Bacteroidales bacterium]|nr:SusC/RagA family TonB-linked outer membrane protein [Bacteroidales bacterium]